MLDAYLVDSDWSSTAEGKKHLIASRCSPQTSASSPPSTFGVGLLERPSTLLSPKSGFGAAGISISEDYLPKLMKYKVLVCSPIGNVGKTSLISKLCGNQTPKKHFETPGLVGHLRYWPVRVKSSGELVYFQIIFYEYGPSAEKNNPNVVQLALDGCEAFIVVFSLTNKSSFDMLPGYISSMKDKFMNYCVSDMVPDVHVVGTHSDMIQQIEVSQQDLTEIRKDHLVSRMKCNSSTVNLPSIALPTTEEEYKKTLEPEIVAFMNNLCNTLLLRDKAALQI